MFGGKSHGIYFRVLTDGIYKDQHCQILTSLFETLPGGKPCGSKLFEIFKRLKMHCESDSFPTRLLHQRRVLFTLLIQNIHFFLGSQKKWNSILI